MQTNINTVPAPVLDGVATILKPYGVDIVALLNRQQDDAAPLVEPLKKKYLTRAEAERYSGVGRWSLWKAEREGKIKASKLADARCGRVLYDRASIDAWLESRMKQPKQQPEA